MRHTQERFSGPLATSQTLYTHLGEGDLADAVAAVAAAHPTVAIGSYPCTSGPEEQPPSGPPGPASYKVKLTFTSRDQAALEAALAAAHEALPHTLAVAPVGQ